ncbi:MAG TPA: cell division protein CrgA [Acidimicrobiia bacterium]|nr:cell division protein CrgA [Acidimicrobiia bacterium]
MPESKRRKPKNRPMSASAAQATVKAKDPSPTWYVALMAGLMVLGVVLVILRFVFEWDQTILIAGLVAIAAGFLMTTNYR